MALPSRRRSPRAGACAGQPPVRRTSARPQRSRGHDRAASLGVGALGRDRAARGRPGRGGPAAGGLDGARQPVLPRGAVVAPALRRRPVQPLPLVPWVCVAPSARWRPWPRSAACSRRVGVWCCRMSSPSGRPRSTSSSGSWSGAATRRSRSSTMRRQIDAMLESVPGLRVVLREHVAVTQDFEYWAGVTDPDRDGRPEAGVLLAPARRPGPSRSRALRRSHLVRLPGRDAAAAGHVARLTGDRACGAPGDGECAQARRARAYWLSCFFRAFSRAWSAVDTLASPASRALMASAFLPASASIWALVVYAAA